MEWTPFDQNGGDLTHALDRIFASRQYIERNPLADFLGRLSSEEESITLSLERYVRKVVRRNSLLINPLNTVQLLRRPNMYSEYNYNVTTDLSHQLTQHL